MEHCYFDNAATTIQKPLTVTEAVCQALKDETFGNPSRGIHDYSLNSYRAVALVREQAKQLFSANEEYEVIFTNNATTSLNMMIHGLLKQGDHVLTTSWEHNSVLRPLYQRKQAGICIDYIHSEPITGTLLWEEAEKKVRPETKAFICSHASNVTGNVIDLEQVKQFCQKYQLLLIVDAAQTAGQLPLDTSDSLIDAICFTGHKSLYGPMGIGGICLKKQLAVKPLMSGGDGVHTFEPEQFSELPGMLESGTLNVPGIIGLGKGIEYVQTIGVEKIKQEVAQLVRDFTDELKKIPSIQIYGDFSNDHAAVVSLNIENIQSSIVSDALWNDYQLATRSGYHCAPKMHENLGTKKQGTVRFSFSSFNTKKEIQQAIHALDQLTRE